MTGCLPQAEHYSRYLEYGGEQDSENSYPQGAFILVERSAYPLGAKNLFSYN